MRQHAVSRLNGDQRYIENRGNGERRSERCRRTAMAMVTVVMAVIVVMMMTVAMLVRLMRRHMLSALDRPRRC